MHCHDCARGKSHTKDVMDLDKFIKELPFIKDLTPCVHWGDVWRVAEKYNLQSKTL
jgi:hypothetical protein